MGGRGFQQSLLKREHELKQWRLSLGLAPGAPLALSLVDRIPIMFTLVRQMREQVRVKS